MLPRCPPGADSELLGEEIRAWISSPSMRRLVAAFGGTLPSATTPELLAWLDGFSGEHWDFRSAQRLERHEVRPSRHGAAVAGVVEQTASALGFTGVHDPPGRVYDHVLILGGLSRSCAQRTEYAAALIRAGIITAGRVAGLTSLRPLTAEEREGTAGEYEVDAMRAAIAAWCEGIPARALAAPSSRPAERRANTADTYAYWARAARPQGDRVLVVTSPIFVPFQHCDAVRLLGLGYGCGVDTIGFDPARVSTPSTAAGTEAHLQEIRSAIRSMRLLHDEL